MAIAVEQTLTGNTDGTSTTVVLSSWSPAANELLVVGVASRRTLGTRTISGNGLTWVQIADVINGQTQMRIVWWHAMSASTPASGAVTVTISGNTQPAQVVALRLSGTDTSGSNGAGAIEASATNDGGITNTNDMLIQIATLTANAWGLAFGSHRNRTLTLSGADTSISINNFAGVSPATASASVWRQLVASPTTITLGANNDLSTNDGWAVVAVSVKPAVTSITGTLSATLAAVTSSATGVLPIVGVSSSTIAAVTLSAAGAVSITGTASLTVGAITSAATGAVAIAAALTATIDPVTVAADGAVAVVGQLVQTLGDVSLVAEGVIVSGRTGALDLTIEPITVSATGVVAIAGIVDTAIEAVTSQATGVLAIAGDAAITIGEIVLIATGGAPIAVVYGAIFGVRSSGSIQGMRLAGSIAGVRATGSIRG